MNCDEIYGVLQQYVDRELTAEEAVEIQRHLEACPPCMQIFHFESSLRRLVRRACSEAAPASLRARILHHGSTAQL